MEFKEKFEKYVCNGDSITLKSNGITFEARIEHDSDSNIDDDDIHNIDQLVTGCNEEQQERLLAAREAWSKNEWFYCGIVLTATIDGIELNSTESLWAIEANYPNSENNYLNEVANDLIAEIMKSVSNELEDLKTKINSILSSLQDDRANV